MPETIDRSWVDQAQSEKKVCMGLYSEVRLLPLSWQLSVNFTACKLSALKWILEGKDLDFACMFVPSKEIDTEKLYFF